MILLKQDLSDLSESLSEAMSGSNIPIEPYTHHRSYESFSAREIFYSLIPDFPILSMIQTIQHIVLIHIPSNFLKYSDLLGSVLLEKYARDTAIAVTPERSVLIAGSPSTLIEISEEGLRFNYEVLDAPDAFHMKEERSRLLKMIGNRSLICDLHPSSGFFALRASKLGHRVILPCVGKEQYKTLVRNAIDNKLHRNIHVVKCKSTELLEELRDSIGKEIYEENTQEEHFLLKNPPIDFIPERNVGHIILRTTDLQELEKFYGFYRGIDTKLPILHIYTESNTQSPVKDLIRKIKATWMNELKDEFILNCYKVYGYLYCVSVQIPPEVGFTGNKLVRNIYDSAEETEEDLRSIILKDIEFMKQAIRDNLHRQASEIVSNLYSSTALKRKIDDDSLSQKKKKK